VRLTLNKILSCSEDPYVQNVLKTNFGTMLRLSKGGDSAWLNAGFVAYKNKDRMFLVFDYIPPGSKGSKTAVDYCHLFTLSYPNEKDDSLPSQVDLPGGEREVFSFDTNDLFIHADQFVFRSGVMAGSTDVFLAAVKGDTCIRFIAKPTGLIFDAVIILPLHRDAQ
jgi:hypothetical protein